MNPVRKSTMYYTYVLQSVRSEDFYYEACLNQDDARSRELYLKSGKGKRFLKSRLKRFLFRTG